MISEKQLGTSYPSIQHFIWCFLLTFGNSLWQCCSGMRRVWRLEGDKICLWIHTLSSAPRYRIPPGDDGEWSCGQEHGPIMESQGTASSAAQSEIIDNTTCKILWNHFSWGPLFVNCQYFKGSFWCDFMDFASLNNKKNVFHIFLRGNVNLWVRDTHRIKSTNKKSPN